MPEGAVDCHLHVFEPARFPYSPARRYTPPAATVADLEAFHGGIGMPRTVFVQPSALRYSNRCLLDGLGGLAPTRAGCQSLMVPFRRSNSMTWPAAGVRGVRINLETGKGRDPDHAARRLSETAQQIDGPRLGHPDLGRTAGDRGSGAATHWSQPNQVIVDHFGLAKTAGGVGQEGFSTLISLMRTKKAYVKLSGPYMISQRKDYSGHYPDRQSADRSRARTRDLGKQLAAYS